MSVRLPPGVVSNGGHGPAKLRHGVLRLVEGHARKPVKRCLSVGPRAGCLAAVDLAGYLGLRVIPVSVRRQGRFGARFGVTMYQLSERRPARADQVNNVEKASISASTTSAERYSSNGALMKWGGRLMPVASPAPDSSVPMNLPLLKNYSIVGVFAGAGQRIPEQLRACHDTLVHCWPRRRFAHTSIASFRWNRSRKRCAPGYRTVQGRMS